MHYEVCRGEEWVHSRGLHRAAHYLDTEWSARVSLELVDTLSAFDIKHANDVIFVRRYDVLPAANSWNYQGT